MRITLLFLFIILSIHCNSQTMNYKITSKETTIGNLSVKRTADNNTVQIEVLSEIEVKLFITIDIKYKLNSTYKNNELFFSSVTTYVNDKVNSITTTKKNEEYYSVTKDEHSTKYLNEIKISDALLYFVEPKGMTKLFSEFDGISKSIKKIGKNKYQIRNPKNGNVGEYQYKNGILQSSINYHNLMTFSLTKL